MIVRPPKFLRLPILTMAQRNSARRSATHSSAVAARSPVSAAGTGVCGLFDRLSDGRSEPVRQPLIVELDIHPSMRRRINHALAGLPHPYPGWPAISAVYIGRGVKLISAVLGKCSV